jgi:hypothetical protein
MSCIVEIGQVSVPPFFLILRHVPQARITPPLSTNCFIIFFTSNLESSISSASTPLPSRKTFTECPLSIALTLYLNAFGFVYRDDCPYLQGSFVLLRLRHLRMDHESSAKSAVDRPRQSVVESRLAACRRFLGSTLLPHVIHGTIRLLPSPRTQVSHQSPDNPPTIAPGNTPREVLRGERWT